MQPENKKQPSVPDPAPSQQYTKADFQDEPFVLEECGDTLWDEALKKLDKMKKTENQRP